MEAHGPKPIDRWLALGSVVLAGLLYLFPKTPLIVAGILILMFAALLHPMWNFWWIEDYLPRRITGVIILASVMIVVGFNVPMEADKSCPGLLATLNSTIAVREKEIGELMTNGSCDIDELLEATYQLDDKTYKDMNSKLIFTFRDSGKVAKLPVGAIDHEGIEPTDNQRYIAVPWPKRPNYYRLSGWGIDKDGMREIRLQIGASQEDSIDAWNEPSEDNCMSNPHAYGGLKTRTDISEFRAYPEKVRNGAGFCFLLDKKKYLGSTKTVKITLENQSHGERIIFFEPVEFR